MLDQEEARLLYLAMCCAEDDKKQKEDYLRATIAQYNYDQDHFSEYLDYQKIDGSNIDNWTLEELQQTVYDYDQQYYG